MACNLTEDGQWVKEPCACSGIHVAGTDNTFKSIHLLFQLADDTRDLYTEHWCGWFSQNKEIEPEERTNALGLLTRTQEYMQVGVLPCLIGRYSEASQVKGRGSTMEP